MKQLLLCAVLCLAALVCLAVADEGTTLRRVARKSKHSDKHKREEESVPETPEVNQNDGYTVVTIPKMASKPSLVDSILSIINDANKLTTAAHEVSSTPPANIDEATPITSDPSGDSPTTNMPITIEPITNNLTEDNPAAEGKEAAKINEVVTTTSAPSEDSPTTTGEPTRSLNSENSTEKNSVVEMKGAAPDIDTVTTTTSAPNGDSPTTTTAIELIVDLNVNNVQEESPVVEVKGDAVPDVDKLAGNITDDFDTSNLMPLVDRVKSLSFENNTKQDAPAIANVCEESKRQLVQMFNKVIGQLSDLFNSMYEKMAAIATHHNCVPSN